MSDNFELDDNYGINENYSDPQVFIIGQEKAIPEITGQLLIAGENNAQSINFEMDRYYDGIDISNKQINILYSAPQGYADICHPINVKKGEEKIRFTWVVPAHAVMGAGELIFSVEFVGDDYVLKTLSCILEIEDGMLGHELVSPPEDKEWYLEMQNMWDRLKATAESEEERENAENLRKEAENKRVIESEAALKKATEAVSKSQQVVADCEKAAEEAKNFESKIDDIREDLGNIIINDIVQKASVNILNPETCVEGSYITNTGTYVNQTGYGHSSKIFVKPGQVLRVTYWGNVKSQRGVFFNSLDEKVSSVVSLNDLKDYTDLPYPYFECTVPDGATYVIVNLRYSYINTAVMITLDNDFPQNFVAYVEEIVKKKLSDDVFVPTDSTFTEETKPANSKAVGDAFKNIIKYKPVLYGKNIMFCGDSITFGAQASLDENGIKKNYGYYIQKATGCNAMFNAISGSTMTNISGRNSFSVDRYKNLGDDLDYIILAFGTNDSSQSKDLIGKYGDTTNETFYGAWKIVIDYLIANYPTTKIGIIGFWRGNQSYEWTDALRDISNKYRIPMLDFMFDRNIPIVGGTDFRSYKPDSPFTVDYNTLVARQQTFLADTVHPNDVGYQYISPIIQNYIESL